MKFDLENHIIHKDDRLIVLNKPTDIAVNDESSGLEHALRDYLQAVYPEAKFCHRLDKVTTGCLIAARDDDAYRHMSAVFEQRTVEKVYHAVIHGSFADEVLEVDFPIRKVGNKKGVIDPRAGKPALTKFKPLKHYNHYTLLACKPISGRFHQIRVHIGVFKSAIVGDTLYGGKLPYLSEIKRNYKPSSRGENPMIDRVALHAQSVSFPHPDGHNLTVEAPYPKDFKALIKLLDKNDLPA